MRFLDRTLATVEEDLALDEALLVEVEAGRERPLLRLWEPSRMAVVLGASGVLHRDAIVEACRRDGVTIARRSSGGGTVVIGPGALNFAVILPRDGSPGLDAVDTAQAYVLERSASVLNRRGRAIEVLGSGDWTIGRRKVAGSAQRRLKTHFLVHATVLYRFPLDRIPLYTRTPERQPSYREGRAHEEFVANLGGSRSELVDALRAAWDAFDEETPALPADALAELVRTKFGDRAWVDRL